MIEVVYYLEVTAENCIIKGEINGFPFYDLNAKYRTYFAAPMNIGLISKENTVVVNILPADSQEITQGKVNLEVKADVKIKTYNNGEISAPELGTVILEQNFSAPGSYPLKFENKSEISFDTFFRSIEKIEDQELVQQFARSIVDMVKSKNIDALEKEFSWKIEQYAHAYYTDPDQYKQFAIDFLLTGILENLPKDYEEQSRVLLLLPYCDKKIWYCYLPNKEDLIYSEEDEDGNVNFIPVYISKMNGKFMIVR
jgi:hypothetical protein